MELEDILKSEVVDLSSIKSFFAEDRDALTQIIEVYISDTEPRIATLEDSLNTVDYPTIKSIAHFLKSSFGLMGIKCADDIAELEKIAERREPETTVKEKLNYIIPICKDSLVEYKRILSDIKAL